MARTLDQSRPYGAVQSGGPGHHHFEQDGLKFMHDGTLWVDPALAALTAQDAAVADYAKQQADMNAAAIQAAADAEAARIAAEAAAGGPAAEALAARAAQVKAKAVEVAALSNEKLEAELPDLEDDVLLALRVVEAEGAARKGATAAILAELVARKLAEAEAPAPGTGDQLAAQLGA